MKNLEDHTKAENVARLVYTQLCGWYEGLKTYRRFEDGLSNGPVQLLTSGGPPCIQAGSGRYLSEFKIEFFGDNVRITELAQNKNVFVSGYSEAATITLISEAIVCHDFTQCLANAYEKVGHEIRRTGEAPPATRARAAVTAMQVLRNVQSDWLMRNLYLEYIEVENNQDDATGVLAKITGAFEQLRLEASDRDAEEEEDRRREWAEGRG